MNRSRTWQNNATETCLMIYKVKTLRKSSVWAYLFQNILLLLYVCKKLCSNQSKYKHLNTVWPVKNSINGHGGVCLSFKNNFTRVKFNFKPICKLSKFVLQSTIKHILYLHMYIPVKLNGLALERMIQYLPSHYLIRYLNGHSHLWGAHQEKFASTYPGSWEIPKMVIMRLERGQKEMYRGVIKFNGIL